MFLSFWFPQISSWSPSDACDPNPCQNEAKCHSMDPDFYCACPEGYEGKTCERLKENCKTTPCQGDWSRLQWYNGIEQTQYVKEKCWILTVLSCSHWQLHHHYSNQWLSWSEAHFIQCLWSTRTLHQPAGGQLHLCVRARFQWHLLSWKYVETL